MILSYKNYNDKFYNETISLGVIGRDDEILIADLFQEYVDEYNMIKMRFDGKAYYYTSSVLDNKILFEYAIYTKLGRMIIYITSNEDESIYPLFQKLKDKFVNRLTKYGFIITIDMNNGGTNHRAAIRIEIMK
jgi:hypothetical protein